MKKSDAIPELIVIDERSKRETVELCGDESEGLRCTLTKGHIGWHECLAMEGQARWQRPRAS